MENVRSPIPTHKNPVSSADVAAGRITMVKEEVKMAQTDIGRLRALTAQLNRYRVEYYSLNAPTVGDEVYDRLFDELSQLERKLGVKMGNSPTQTVGWPAVDKLQKVSHPIPLLSLDKTKRVEDLCAFMGGQQVMLMLKLDGLTLKLVY